MAPSDKRKRTMICSCFWSVGLTRIKQAPGCRIITDGRKPSLISHHIQSFPSRNEDILSSLSLFNPVYEYPDPDLFGKEPFNQHLQVSYLSAVRTPSIFFEYNQIHFRFILLKTVFSLKYQLHI